MTTPYKSEIIERAKELYFNEEWKNGNKTSINPTNQELRESGYVSLAVSELMHAQGYAYQQYIEEAQRKTCLNRNIQKGEFPLDIEECKRSNTLISGTNQTGKSMCAMSVADLLMRKQWEIIVFDTCGQWRTKSSIPNHLIIKDKNACVNSTKSVIYDLSLLKLKHQKSFTEKFLERLWILRVVSQNDNWVLCIFEEFQLLARNLRGELSQNLLRIMSVGANHRIRCLGITPDLSLIDCAFIRLCQQRYHFRLGNEPNAKRRFRAYYGLDWCRVTQNLDVGFCTYVNKEKLKVWKIPLFQREQIRVRA